MHPSQAVALGTCPQFARRQSTHTLRRRAGTDRQRRRCGAAPPIRRPRRGPAQGRSPCGAPSPGPFRTLRALAEARARKGAHPRARQPARGRGERRAAGCFRSGRLPPRATWLKGTWLKGTWLSPGHVPAWLEGACQRRRAHGTDPHDSPGARPGAPAPRRGARPRGHRPGVMFICQAPAAGPLLARRSIRRESSRAAPVAPPALAPVAPPALVPAGRQGPRPMAGPRAACEEPADGGGCDGDGGNSSSSSSGKYRSVRSPPPAAAAAALQASPQPAGQISVAGHAAGRPQLFLGAHPARKPAEVGLVEPSRRRRRRRRRPSVKMRALADSGAGRAAGLVVGD